MMLRRCLGCPTLIPKDTNGGRCSKCAAEKRAERGSPRNYGYDADHDRRRAAMLPSAIGQPCPGCGEPMTPNRMDAAHSTDLAANPTAVADHMTCSRCNRSAGGRLAHGLPPKPR